MVSPLLLLRRKFIKPTVRGLISGFDPGAVSFARASAGTRFNIARKLVSEANDVARFDYDPANSKSLGLLIEPQRTNIFPYSTMTGDQGGCPTGWSTGNTFGGGGTPVASIYGNADGAVAWSFTVSNSRSFLAPMTYAVSANTTYTYSALVESNPNSLPAHAFLQFQNTPSGSSWVFEKDWGYFVPSAGERVSLTLTVGATSGGAITRFGLGVDAPTTGTIIMSRPQLEVNVPKASSYIPTTSSSAVTRAADVLQFTIPSEISTLRYVFDDNSTQDVSVSSGAYTVPTNLNQKRIKRIQAV